MADGVEGVYVVTPDVKIKQMTHSFAYLPRFSVENPLNPKMHWIYNDSIGHHSMSVDEYVQNASMKQGFHG